MKKVGNLHFFVGKISSYFRVMLFCFTYVVFATSLICVNTNKVFASNVNLPNILYPKDVENYQKIFSLQEKGRFTDADKIIKNINNDILMGYVLHQRYMSPYYKTLFSEAKTWLSKYYDMPNATDIYKIGLRKGAKRELRQPKREAKKTKYFGEDFRNSYQMIQHSYKGLSKKDRKEVNYMIKIFNNRMRKGYTKNARQVLENPNSKRLLARNDYLRMQAYLAFTYFLNNEDDMAILWAREPAEELNFYLANWTLGLVHWRMRDYVKARDYFKNIAFTKQIPADVVSMSAYWAWRANDKIEDKELRDDGDIFLETASSYPKTFYGILASKQMNKKLEINWYDTELTLQNTKEIISWQGGVRALALLQLNKKNEAVEELKFLINTENDDYSSDLINAVLAVAEVANMPQLSINIADYIREPSDVGKFKSCDYPTIDWELDDGWSIDKALVNALVRQESRFNPKAKSFAGARGLMQIMPATASFIMRDASFRKKQKGKLFDENINLKVGQLYIEYLLTLPSVNKNLFKFLVAYNAGPGNLKTQEAKIYNPDDDPLLFIESLSIKETRIYIKRVMANFWIYRNKLSQKSESLDDVVNGLWPMYVSKGDIIAPKYSKEEQAYLEDFINDEEKKKIDNEEENSDEIKTEDGVPLEYDETDGGENIF